MNTRDSRSRSSIKLDAAVRLIHWRYLSGVRPHYLVTEYPKSGGSWVSQLISEYLEIPFPRNSSIRLFQDTCLLHGHHLYSSRFKNAVYVLRDGRDNMASAYYHCLFHNDRNSFGMVERHRERVPFDSYDDIVSNMPRFIEYMFTSASRGRHHFNWAEFVNSIDFSTATTVKYEDLLNDPIGKISKTLERLTHLPIDRVKIAEVVETFNFRNQVSRNPGEEDSASFLRKGIAGDWKTKFSVESREVFNHYAGKALVLAGYENDSSWVTRL